MADREKGYLPMLHAQAIKAGIVQLDIKRGENEVNLDAACDGIRRLSDREAGLAALPEMWPCGFDNPRLALHAKKTPGILNNLSSLAQTHGLIIAGSMPEEDGGDIYNTLYLVDKTGAVAGRYRKVHLFEPTGEKDYFKAGDRPVVCKTSAGPIGLLTCYDLRFPELCRSLALQGARLVIVSAQWPASRIDHWDVLLRARAIENQVFMVASNRCGQDGSLRFNGHSQIVSPAGQVLAKLDNGAGEITARIDFRDITAARAVFDCLRERTVSAYAL